MKLIVVGFGFIGRNFVKALQEKMNFVRKVFPDFKLVGVSDIEGYLLNEGGLDLSKLSSIKKVTEYGERFKEGTSIELMERGEADVLVEATPTNVVDGEPGLSHISKALSLGMHVVTSNKGPLVVAFRRLMDLAESKGVKLLYEATVAGAIPIFSLVRECLKGSSIKKIYGMLNGTTNYILTRMHFDEVSLEIALKEAQERGIAERDPSYDVDGIDAACKLVILTNAILNRDASIKDVSIGGIRKVGLEAVKLAKKSGCTIKLVAMAGEILDVRPRLIPLNHPLCVHGTLNAVHFETDLAGELTLVGRGAGRETVGAMINDFLSLTSSR